MPFAGHSRGGGRTWSGGKKNERGEEAMSHTGASGRGTRFGMEWVWQTLGRQFSLGLVTGFGGVTAVVGFGYLMALIYLVAGSISLQALSHNWEVISHGSDQRGSK